MRDAIGIAAGGLAILLAIGIVAQLNPIARSAVREAVTISFWAELAALLLFLALIAGWAVLAGGA